MAHACDLSTWEDQKFEVALGYIINSRPASVTQDSTVVQSCMQANPSVPFASRVTRDCLLRKLGAPGHGGSCR